jgi:cation transport ATPase
MGDETEVWGVIALRDNLRPSAARAIVPGSASTDVAMETADVVTQNPALSALVISVLVAGAITGMFTLPITVLAHEVSEFVVIGSGLRMLRA